MKFNIKHRLSSFYGCYEIWKKDFFLINSVVNSVYHHLISVGISRGKYMVLTEGKEAPKDGCKGQLTWRLFEFQKLF